MTNKNQKPKLEIYRYSASIGNNRTINNNSIKRQKKPRRIPLTRHILFLLIVCSFIILSLTYVISHQTSSPINNKNPNQSAVLSDQYCSNNSYEKSVVVSISRRHLWACNGSISVFNSPVITGNQTLASDLTPLGSYKVFGKYTHINLIGSNSSTSWNDPVNYWIPFLQNQYGQFGFHDAPWRIPSEFGNIAPYSTNASHGCVECPLKTAAWLHKWINVGTNVLIVK